jgi:hypothetical protein
VRKQAISPQKQEDADTIEVRALLRGFNAQQGAKTVDFATHACAEQESENRPVCRIV